MSGKKAPRIPTPRITPERLTEIENLAEHTYRTAVRATQATGAVIVLELVHEIRAAWAEASAVATRDTSPGTPGSSQ